MTKYVSLVDGSEFEMPTNAQATGWPGRPTPLVREDEAVEGPQNIYWLFAGSDYCPAGGIKDFIGMFDTIGEAKAAFDRLKYNDWGHIITVEKGSFAVVIETYDEMRKGKKYYGWRRPR